MTSTEKRIRYIEECAIMAAHPSAKDLGEAKEEDVERYCRFRFISSYKYNPIIEFYENDEVVLIHADTKYEHTFLAKGIRGTILFPHYILNGNYLEILGLPCNLSRVLNALNVIFEDRLQIVGADKIIKISCTFDFSTTLDVKTFGWKLLNSNGTSCTIHDQDEETIIAISNLLNFKE